MPEMMWRVAPPVLSVNHLSLRRNLLSFRAATPAIQFACIMALLRSSPGLGAIGSASLGALGVRSNF